MEGMIVCFVTLMAVCTALDADDDVLMVNVEVIF